jgi:decaprenylphospho-beta-D-ribofuranose 2-oxidase
MPEASSETEPSPQLLSGWGRTAPSAASVIAPVEAEIAGLLETASNDPGPHGIIARGLGRAYGDAAQCAGGTVISTSGLDTIGSIDPDSGLVEVGAGVSLDALIRHGLRGGWFIPVSPGTRSASVGGAIAADVHGKNHHLDGSFCQHVRELTLATPTGTFTVSAQTDPALFWATAGGMGLTGVVTRATVAMRPVETAWMSVDTERHNELDSLMEAMERIDPTHRYSVAWVDCVATGRSFGRGVITAGDHANLDDLDSRKKRNPRLEPRERSFSFPLRSGLPARLINRTSVRAFNEVWFAKAPRNAVGEIQHFSGFFHPLDAIADWNLLYGRRGFLQYQFVVDDEHASLISQAISALQRAGAPCTLSVLKRFGPGDPGPLSFPTKGWTLTLDVAVGAPDLRSALHALDEAVATAGGRVYLAKDSRMDPATFTAMYPRVGELLEQRARVDPKGLLRSDLARRLGLCEAA